MTRATTSAACLALATSLATCGALAAGAPASPAAAQEAGTTVVGERETALGLFLTPWQEEGPAALDHPPVLFDVAPSSVDADAYARSSRFERDLAGWRRARVEPGR